MLLTHSKYSHDFPIRSVYRRSPRWGHAFHWMEAGWQHEQTLVLLHGLMAHSMAYRMVARSLARHYRVVIPDLPAHGRDETFRTDGFDPRVPDLVSWLEELLLTVDSRQVHLVGHSLGATVAFLAARDRLRDQHLASLTLVSPGLQISIPRWTPHLIKRLPVKLARLGVNRAGIRLYEPIQWRRTRMSGHELRSYLEPIQQLDRLEFILALGVDLVSTPDRLEGAERFNIPTLIVWGEKDHLLPVATAHRLRDELPDARLHVFNNCGHCPMEDCPVDFVHALHGFLSI